jgi:hypothetical protein
MRSASEPIDDSLYFDHNNQEQPILYLAIAANLLGNHETLSTGFGSRRRIPPGDGFLTAVLFFPQQILVHIRSSSSLANPKQEKHWRGFFLKFGGSEPSVDVIASTKKYTSTEAFPKFSLSDININDDRYDQQENY